MNLQEQIAEFEAKGCVVGDRKWEESDIYDDTMFTTLWGKHKIEVMFCKHTYTMFCLDNDYKLTSTTLEEALCEALDIVKAKVMELAKELGFVVFDKEQMWFINDLVLHTNINYANRGQQRKLNQLQQYIEEQGNE